MVQSSDIIQQMKQQTRTWEDAQDRRAIFLECYTLMTGNMLRAIDDRRFRDCTWAKQLLLRFADYYFVALDAYGCTDKECVTVWTFAHDCSCGKDLHVLQHLLLGINAHINYDLVLSLVDLLDPEWNNLSDAERQDRYHDHCLVNEIIAATIDTVQDDVVERYDPRMDIIDRLFGRLDERLLSSLITHWRQQVWDKAMRFLETNSEQREPLRRELEESVMKKARWILLTRS
ncbi:DUF5995 family protein [Flavilitoribacter nigricans]|uniref:Uncharacterized protein n=1 Tax=Flavilitoribacter nigricans (strain ATCC 23147 / DSM 23189 / NBRC 102662 / NCIMB 1420 / SS-2) TaxID=1122177 RepID=A0A2D0NFA9_FLAN2|nr:DUF5995 family protein [Flavilitoribacter nigricans]PHN07070.1 hypothetical protein CRP01_07510 [Flavilitoribacter nigricans DSM 23189 = NBRC 102662]